MGVQCTKCKDTEEEESAVILSLRDWGIRTTAQPVNLMEASRVELLRIQRQAIKQYPFLRNIYESVLVTDNLSPDNPIIYCNDNFEKMTLYAREEILGRNCRFLQGRHTNRQTVQMIREACQNAQQLDVEILNYRKDGTAFWNRFLMIPIFGRVKGRRRICNFIAIQKDVTFLKRNNLKPQKWSPIEVAIWLDNKGLSKYSESFLSQNITGTILLKLDDKESLSRIGVIDKADQKIFINQIQRLISKKSFDLYAKSSENILLQNNVQYKPLGKQDDDQVATVRQSVPVNKNALADTAEIDQIPHQEFWNKTEDKKNVCSLGFAIKCLYADNITIFLVRPNITFDRLQRKIHSIYKGKLIMQMYHVVEGDKVLIENDEDLKSAFSLTDGNTVHITLKESLIPRSFAVQDSARNVNNRRKKSRSRRWS